MANRISVRLDNLQRLLHHLAFPARRHLQGRQRERTEHQTGTNDRRRVGLHLLQRRAIPEDDENTKEIAGSDEEIFPVLVSGGKGILLTLVSTSHSMCYVWY